MSVSDTIAELQRCADSMERLVASAELSAADPEESPIYRELCRVEATAARSCARIVGYRIEALKTEGATC